MKQKTKIISGAVSTVLAGSMLFAVPVMADDSYGVVTNVYGDVLNVRSDAGVTNQWLGVLRENEGVTIVGFADDENGQTWYEIVYRDGTAFVSGEYIALTDGMEAPVLENTLSAPFEATGKIVNLNGDILNIRNGAGIGHSRLGAFSEGAMVNIIGQAYDESGTTWYEIEYNGQSAFICGNYVSLDGENEFPVDYDDDEEYTKYGKVINIDSNDVLNVRAAAGTASSIMGTLKTGSPLVITGETSDRNNTKWYRIEFNGQTGYVHSYYVTETEFYEEEPEEEILEVPEAGYVPTVGEQILDRAIAYADDDSHGYRNVSGDNTGYGSTGSFDCGGLITRVLWDMGLLPTNKLYEPNSGMQWVLGNYGFESINYSYDALQPGDILYQYGHTVIYAGNGKVVGAHGYMGNYESGDQYGNEISVTDFYGNWELIFRYVG